MGNKLTEQQIENHRMGYAIMAGIPASRIELSICRRGVGLIDAEADREFIHTCGTSGCVAGWLSAHSYFKQQGLTIGTWGNGLIEMRLFGNTDMFGSGEMGLEGKLEALRRFRYSLVKAKAITAERNHELIAYENSLTE